MRKNDAESWKDAVKVDAAIRTNGGLGRLKYQPYMHRSLKPLDQVDLSTPAERGQVEFGFLQECDGMCGV